MSHNRREKAIGIEEYAGVPQGCPRLVAPVGYELISSGHSRTPSASII
jgi:hypothetical protein